MTDPPKKATSSAFAWPTSLAAAAVRTLASVAEYIPVNPARIEKSAPTRKATAVYRSMKTVKRANTARTNQASTEYSRLKNTIAPVRISEAMEIIAADPAGSRRMLVKSINARMIPTSATAMVNIDSAPSMPLLRFTSIK
jgi:hypothetical protein